MAGCVWSCNFNQHLTALSYGRTSIKFYIHNAFSVIVIYAVGGCILSGIFQLEKPKPWNSFRKDTWLWFSNRFSTFNTCTIVCRIIFFKVSNGLLGILSLICFIFAIVFFALFVMADKPNYRGTIIAFEGLWQRLSLLSMYLPIAALCIFQK